MYKVWLERVDQEPTLLSSARKHGLTRLDYMSLKPEQLSAIDAGKGYLRQRTDWIRQVTGAAVLCRLAYRASYRDINIEQTRSDGCVASPVAYARPFVAVCLRLDGAVAHLARVYASAAHGS